MEDDSSGVESRLAPHHLSSFLCPQLFSQSLYSSFIRHTLSLSLPYSVFGMRSLSQTLLLNTFLDRLQSTRRPFPALLQADAEGGGGGGGGSSSRNTTSARHLSNDWNVLAPPTAASDEECAI